MALRLSLFLLSLMLAAQNALCQQPAHSGATAPKNQACDLKREGEIVSGPHDLTSNNGVLRVALSMRSSVDASGNVRYCYTDEHGNRAPTLRVHPGDTLILTLENKISASKAGSLPQKATKLPGKKMVAQQKHDPCTGGKMSPFATNLHFHGMAVPAGCHQDEALKTLIESGDEPFEYRIRIPDQHPPGLYWYHPHLHGLSEEQILGGASGALIVEGMAAAVPRVAGLPERVFIIRDQSMPAPGPTEKPDPNRPTKQLSIDYIPVPYPNYPPAVIKMKPGERQFWRVLNASADTYLDLSVEYGGKRQNLEVVALDGVPLRYGEPGARDFAPQQTHVFLPQGSRAEFIVIGPPAGVSGRLLTSAVYRGASDEGVPVGKPDPNQPALRMGQDDVDPTRPLANIVAATETAPLWVAPAINGPLAQPPAPLSAVRPVRKRKLYFSEKLVNPADPKSATLFFITEEGKTPAVFDPNRTEPDITVQQGDVEDWTIENRSQESHTFHAHQLHFIVVGRKGGRWEEPTPRDTVDVPAWDGFRQYPSITVRMDFRDPEISGTVPFHCHILQHIDGGMMGTVRIEPVKH